jgi:hypothetical protein
MTIASNRWASLGLLALLAACSGKDPEDTSPSTTPPTDTDLGTDTDTEVTGPDTEITGSWTFDELTGGCEPDGSDGVGAFEIAHWDGFATVTGSVADGVVPTEVLTPQEAWGDCQLFQKFYPFCDPPCGAGEVCDHDETCIPYPANQGVGTVALLGTAEPVFMEPDGSNYYWDTQIPYPLFATGDLIQVSATGGDIDAFELRGLGVDDAILTEPLWEVVSGEDLTVTWVPSDAPSRIRVVMSVDQHGNSPVSLKCEAEDTGALTISADLLDALLQYGVSGFATGTLRRVTADHISTELGCVEMLVYSHTEAQVQVQGHTPCVSDLDCEDGYVCDIAINTCVPE